MADSDQNTLAGPRGFLNIAHRGASAHEHENTIAAIDKAIALQADMVEFDLRCTSDGAIVLFHDSYMADRSGRKKPVSHTTFEDLSLFAGTKGFEIPTLDQVLREFGDKIAMDIEIKIGGFEEEIVRLMRVRRLAFEPMIASFKPHILKRIRKLDSSVKTGLIIGSKRFETINMMAAPLLQGILSRLEYDSIHLHRSLGSPRLIESLKAAGFEVYIWTVNDVDEARGLLNLGVDGIISDYPDMLYALCTGVAASLEPVVSRSVNGRSRFAYAAGR